MWTVKGMGIYRCNNFKGKKTMSTYKWIEPKRFAVIRRWKGNKDFQVIEYFKSTGECRAYINEQKKSNEYDYEIAKYE